MALTKVTNQFNKTSASVESKPCVLGFTAGREINGVHVFLVAPTMDQLREAWKVFHYRTLVEEKVQRIAMFNQDHLE